MPRITRRALGAAVLLPPLAAPRREARAQGAWPTRPVRVIVPVAPGGVADSSIRVISDRLSAALGQPLVVENRSGASNSIGAGAVAASRGDGTVFLLDTINHVVNPHVIRGLPFDYATAFAPVTQVARIPLVLVVRDDLPAADLPAFLALARARSGALSLGNSGTGTAAQLSSALLQVRSGQRWTEVPYRGGSDAARDVAAGALDGAFISLLSAVPLARAGRGRILAVTTAERSALLPDVPAVAESGFPGYELDEWTGLFAPAGTPEPILDRLAVVVAEVLREPEVVARLAQLGAEPVGSPRGAFAAFVARGRAEAARLVANTRVEPN